MTNYLSSFLGKVGRWHLPTSLFKKYPASIKNFSLTPFLSYLMLILINPVYLLLTDKTNEAGILMIIKGHFDDYIHKKNLSKRHNTQDEIYFTFAMQLKIEINPVYSA